MFDLMKSYSSDQKERPVLSGAVVAEEGALYAYVSDLAGGRAVRVTAATDTAIAGFGVCDAKKVTTETVVETITVPAAGGVVFLKNQHIVTASERVHNDTTNTYMAPGAGATQYVLTIATGSISFNVAQAGNTVTVQYRYDLTMAQVMAKYHERSINNRAQDYFSTISLACGDGEIFTSMYNTAATLPYVVNALVYPAAGGLVSVDNGGGSIIGRVSQAPSVNNGLLGVKYLLPV